MRRAYYEGSRQASVPPSPQSSRNLTIVMAVVIVFLVAGVGAAYSVGLFSTGGLTHKQTTASGLSSTTSVSASSSATSMPPGCVLTKTVSDQGYSVEVFVSNSTKVGGKVCIGIVVQNVSGGAPVAQGITQQLNITDSSGRSVTVLAPAVTVNGTLQQGHFVAGNGVWDSSVAYSGITPQAGTYHLTVGVKIPASGSNAAVELTAETDFLLTS